MPAGPDDWALVREIRLRALADAPSAFAALLDQEDGRPASAWRERLASATGRTFLAMEEGTPVGLATAFISSEEDSRAHLVSMWVAPASRRSGIATALVRAALGWATDRGLREVELWVTEGNIGARRLYEGLGFTPTGDTQPLPSDPSFVELRMSRATGA